MGKQFGLPLANYPGRLARRNDWISHSMLAHAVWTVFGNRSSMLVKQSLSEASVPVAIGRGLPQHHASVQCANCAQLMTVL